MTDRIYIRDLPRTDRRLGRRVHHDDRSRGFAYNTSGLSIVTARHDRRVPVLNQNDLGACTGFAGIGCLGTEPYFASLQTSLDDRILANRSRAIQRQFYTLDEPGAIQLYSDATKVDPFAGEYPPTDTGSDGLTIAKVLKAAGEISGYRWTFSLDDALKALSVTPFITGTEWYECVPPGTRVLTTDLEWVPVEKLTVGDSIIGFDEHGAKSAAYRRATVVDNSVTVQPCVEVTTDRGVTTVSANHLFLGSASRKHPRSWLRADRLVPGNVINYFGDPWEADTSWEAGWLAGFYDGEGCLSTADNLLTCAQMPDKVAMEFAHKLLTAKGYDFGHRIDKTTGVGKWYLRGENAKCRFLGEIRPQRLLARSYRAWEGDSIRQRRVTPVTVQSVRDVGQHEVHAVGTTTRTLVTDGYLSHNSMFRPDHDGRVRVNLGSGLAGGHEYVADGIDAEREQVWFRNSWGDWGPLLGRFWMSFADYGTLLARQGDVTIFTPLTEPAPTPPPDPDEAFADVLRPWVPRHHCGKDRPVASAAKTWLAARGL